MHQIKMKILFYIACQKEDEIIVQSNIANELKLSKSTLNYHFSNLKAIGLINKNNRLTEEGKRVVQFFNHWDKTLQKKLRAHKIQISINIKHLPSDFFNLKHSSLQPFTNKRYRGLKGQLLGSKVLFYSSNKLVVVLPDIFANTSEEIVGAIEDCIAQIIYVLKQEFKGIILGSYEIYKYTSMHCAIIDSVIAENFLLKKGSCYKSEGVCIDGSHGKAELEVESLTNIFENTEVLLEYDKLVASLKNNKCQEVLSNANKNGTNDLSMRKGPQLPEGYGGYFL